MKNLAVLTKRKLRLSEDKKYADAHAYYHKNLYIKFTELSNKYEQELKEVDKELEYNASMANIKFILDGCDISFVAEAPGDITLKQLLKQCDRIKPDWGACGITSADPTDKVELRITYDNIEKVRDCSCTITEVLT